MYTIERFVGLSLFPEILVQPAQCCPQAYHETTPAYMAELKTRMFVDYGIFFRFLHFVEHLRHLIKQPQ